MTVRASEIAEHIDARLQGTDFEIEGVTAISQPRARRLSWSNKPVSLGQWSKGMAVIMPPRLGAAGPFAVLRHERPRLAMIWAIRRFFPSAAPAVRISDSAEVSPTCTIGADGFSYEMDPETEEWAHFPHSGGVEIGDIVDIGAQTVIHRGVLTDTIIMVGSKIGSLCNIGHGVVIGADTLIAPMVSIGGSARIGDEVTIWQGAMIKNGVTIGSGATIGMGAVVLEDVPGGETWVGNPARKIK